MTEPRFIGLENFAEVMKDPVFFRSLENTVILTALQVIGSFLLGLLAACVLNEKIIFRSMFRGLMLIPFAMPLVCAGFIWQYIYNLRWGILNYLFMTVGIIREPINWLLNADTVFPAALIYYIWRGTPLWCVVLLAGLQSMPSTLFEAAKIDGAGLLQRFRYLTLPHLKPLIFSMAVLRIVWVFNSFGSMYVLTQGGPAHLTEILSITIYNFAFNFYRFGEAGAISVIMLIILLIFIGIVLKGAKE